MDKNKIVNLARELGVEQHNLMKGNRSLVQAVQKTQGKEPCYMTDRRYICDGICEWSKSCKKLVAAWLR